MIFATLQLVHINFAIPQLAQMTFVNFAMHQLVHMKFVEIGVASQPRLHH